MQGVLGEEAVYDLELRQQILVRQRVSGLDLRVVHIGVDARGGEARTWLVHAIAIGRDDHVHPDGPLDNERTVGQQAGNVFADRDAGCLVRCRCLLGRLKEAQRDHAVVGGEHIIADEAVAFLEDGQGDFPGVPRDSVHVGGIDMGIDARAGKDVCVHIVVGLQGQRRQRQQA